MQRYDEIQKGLSFYETPCTSLHDYYYYIRLTAFFQDNLGKPATER